MVVSINARACGYFGDRIQVTKMAVTRNIEFDSGTKFSTPKLLSIGFTLNSTSLQPGSYIFESQRSLRTTIIFCEKTDDVFLGMTVCWYVRSPTNSSSTFATHVHHKIKCSITERPSVETTKIIHCLQ